MGQPFNKLNAQIERWVLRDKEIRNSRRSQMPIWRVGCTTIVKQVEGSLYPCSAIVEHCLNIRGASTMPSVKGVRHHRKPDL